LEIEALWLTLHSYFAWTIAFDTRLIRWNVSRSFWSWRPLPPLGSKIQKKTISSNSTFYSLCVDVLFVGVSLKTARIRIFFWTPAKVWSNLMWHLVLHAREQELIRTLLLIVYQPFLSYFTGPRLKHMNCLNIVWNYCYIHQSSLKWFKDWSFSGFF